MLSDLGDLFLRLIDSFTVVFGLLTQLFHYRPWLLPLIPVTILVLLVGLRMRVASRPEEPPDPAAARRQAGR